MKFATKLNILNIAIVLITGISTAFFTYHYQRSFLTKEIHEKLGERAFGTMKDIDRLLYHNLTNIKVMASDPFVRLARQDDYQIITKRLLDYRNRYQTFLNISYFNLEGVKVAGTSGLMIGNKDSEVLEWEERLKNEEAFLHVGEFEEINAVVIHFVSLIRNMEDKPIGVLVANVPIERLYDITKEALGIFKNDQAKVDLVNDQGMILYSNHNHRSIFRDKIHPWPVFKNNGSQFSQEEIVFVENKNDLSVVAKQKGFLDYKGHGWALILTLSKKVAFASANHLRNELIILLIPIILLSGFLGLIFARILSYPISLLKRAAEQVKGGQLVVSIPVVSDDEIGDLARTFQGMTDNLNRTMKALEQEVQKHKEDLQVLHDSQQQLQAILDNSTMVIYAKDWEGRYLFVNRQFEVLFNAPKKQIIGKNDYDFFPSIFADKFRENDLKVLRLQRPTQYEENVAQDDGIHTYISIKFPLFDVSGKPYAVCGLSADITDRKKAEEILNQQKKDLEKINKELDNFVYMASHDLRAPLRGVEAFASYLDKFYGKSLDKRGRDFLKEIQKGTQVMSQIIEDLLELSHISRIKNPYELTSMREVVNLALKRFQYEIKLNKVQLQIFEQLPSIECDRIKMEQVFANLISNAIKFSSKNEENIPKVEIGYVEQEHAHQFFVKDNGIGVDPQFHDRIFQIFERLHSHSDYDGTGVGLAIVKKVVEEHRGSVWIESREGLGAAFYFSIPKDLQIEEDVSI